MPSTGLFSDPQHLLDSIQLIGKTYTISADAVAFATERIKDADQHVRFECSIILDFTKIKFYDESPVATPFWLQELSNHKACEMAYVRLGSVKRGLNEQNDLDYWRNVYQMHLKDLKSGKILLVDSTGTSVSTGTTIIPTPASTTLRPYQGFGKWGTNPPNEDLETYRNAGLEP